MPCERLVPSRLRPEAYGGLVQRVMMDGADYPLHDDVKNSQALVAIDGKFNSYLLPMAFPEGSPGVLEEQSLTYREGGSFTLTRFDGTQVVI